MKLWRKSFSTTEFQKLPSISLKNAGRIAENSVYYLDEGVGKLESIIPSDTVKGRVRLVRRILRPINRQNK